MSRLELGLTPQERKNRDRARRERNCFAAMAVVGLVAALLLFWMDA